MRRNVYSVGQVNAYIKNMFAQDFMLRQISVSGEISNCKYHSSGHIYFTLKDSSGIIQAVMFAGNRRGLTFHMKEGDNVVVTGSIEVYERDGKYQLYAREITLAGAGDLYLKYEALKKELEEMGMFAKEYKQDIPKYAKTIGIVTAPTGAAVRDINNIAQRRNPYVQLILYPALVQGEGAAQSIVNGIHAMEQLHPDLLIVGRGGGSIEDLWAFNEEIVARAIFDCPIPVISAAAELAVFDIQDFYGNIGQYRMQMNRLMKAKLDIRKQKQEYLKRQLLLLSPQSRIHTKRQYAADLEERLRQQMKQQIIEARHQMEIFAGTLDGLSPAKKLMQGYSVAVNDAGRNIRSTKDVQPGEDIMIRVTDGAVLAKVTGIKEQIRWEKN